MFDRTQLERYDVNGSYASSFAQTGGWWQWQVGRQLPGWAPGADRRPFLIGGFDWTGFDYKGECQVCMRAASRSVSA